jgi:hypothetical protein
MGIHAGSAKNISNSLSIDGCQSTQDFLVAVEVDSVLQEKFNGVPGGEALLAIAKEAGYIFC